ncbi:MAG: winged helix-turn-helix domain-containing protein [Acidobacteria bacterium]|nr:winged helix-turn-helix domain-containing protein [Acidobacteriota bacterium]MBI3425649.1 winged helix-turn-helix domain-containing protein [Acidobacteriota bacterium]
MSHSARRLYEFDGFRLDPAERLLVCDGTPVPLAPKAFEVLVMLASQSGRLLTKDELLRAVWAEAVVEENNLDKNISALRKALGEHGAERKLIETVRGHGYRFNAHVIEIIATENVTDTIVTGQGQAAPQVLTGNEPESTARGYLPPLADAPAPNPPAQPVERRNKLALALPVVLLLAVAMTLWVRPWRAGQQAAVPRELKVARLTNGGFISNAVLSPDGGYFTYTEQDGDVARLWLRQVAGGQPLALVPELRGAIQGLTFAPDSQAVYFVTVDSHNPQGALYRVLTLGGPVTKLLTGIVSPITFAPDGRRFAFIRLEDLKGEGNSLVLADSTGGNERVVLTLSGLERFLANGPSWAPDGKEIACQLMHGLTKTSDVFWQVVGVNVASGAQRLLTTQQWDGCGRLVWLRDGSGLIMIGTKQGESSTTARDAVWFIAQPDGAIRRITTDLSRHFYRSLSVTDDSQALLIIPFNRSSQIWSVAARGAGAQTRYDAHTVVQLTTGTGEGRAGIVSLDNGDFVYVARTGEHVDLWQVRNASSQPQQLTTEPPFLEELSAPTDGRYFVFASNRAGNSHLFRVNRAGADLRQLTSGERREIESDCSPDGRWVVYTSQTSEPGKIAAFKLWKIPAEGGTPVSLTEDEAHSPHFSPDGQGISYVYMKDSGKWQAVVMPADGGAPLKTFELPSTAESDLGCRWTPDGRALTYVVKGKTFDNLWLQPLNGRAPQPLTDFNSGEIYNYVFSRDGQRLFLARGYSIRDVLLIKDFR